MKPLTASKFIRGALLCAVAMTCASCGVHRSAFHTWQGPDGNDLLVMDVHKDAYSWIGKMNLSSPRLYLNEDGRAEVEVTINNPLAVRRTGGYRWIWSDDRGMSQRSLTSEAYRPLYVSSMGRKVIRSTSPFPNPRRVELHIHN